MIFFNLIKIESFQSEENAKIKLNDLLSNQEHLTKLKNIIIDKKRFLYKFHGEDKNNIEKEIEILEKEFEKYNKDNFYSCRFNLIESNLNG